MSKELEALERVDDYVDEDYDYCQKGYYRKDYKLIKKALQEKAQLEEELGCSLVDLLNGLKSKQSALRYFDKHDSIVNHCEEGWYVNMIMYGWIPLKDFIKGLN